MKSTEHPNANYTLILFGGEQIDALPTAGLFDESGRGFPEAYEHIPASEQYPPVWRARDDSFDPPGTVYRKVRAIVRKWGATDRDPTTY